MKLVAIGAVLVVALSAAGCGGGGGGGGGALSKEEYASRLNGICTDLNAKEKEIGEPSSIAELGTKGPELLAAFDEAVGKAEALQAPDELADTVDAFIAKAKQLHGVIDELIDAAKANDLAKIQELGTRADALNRESNDLARELGAPACAEG